MTSRSKRAEIAKETVKICDRRHYLVAGNRVSIRVELERAVTGTVHYDVDSGDHLRETLRAVLNQSSRRAGKVGVCDGTTLAVSRELAAEGRSVACLNFASAKNPGGGFLNGSEAQEESLSRASGLYACIAPQQKHYIRGRQSPNCLYTDSMLYSPSVPVFRDDDDQLLLDPVCVSMITSPAVNRGALKRGDCKNVRGVMVARMVKIFCVALAHGHDTLVLGAWGCGVFRNEPEQVAEWFEEALERCCLCGPRHEADHVTSYRSAFDLVAFAIRDRRRSTTRAAFAARFGSA